MNTTIELLKQHHSVRQFIADKSLSKQKLKTIIDCAKQAPSWMNGQHYSIIVITDSQIKSLLAQLSPRNEHIATCSAFLIFCADFTHIVHASALQRQVFDITDNNDVLITAAMDAALAMQNAVVAAESMKLGTVCVGGIRDIAGEIIETFNFPQFTYPLCGLSIGYPQSDEYTLKPRLNDAVNVGYNQYPYSTLNHILNYDKKLPGWMSYISKYYSQQPLKKTNTLLKKQGF